MELLPASGQQFVGIGLIAGIPHDFVFRRIQEILQRDRQLHHTQIGGQVPPDIRNHRKDLLTDLLAQFRKLLRGEAFQISGTVDIFQQRHCTISLSNDDNWAQVFIQWEQAV